jgi:hypothetical protein
MPTSSSPARWPWLVAAVLLALAAVGAVESSHQFRECVQSGNPTYPTYLTVLGVRWYCLGEFVEDHGEAITATFTAVLAVSTILLWLSTREAAYAAKAAADHIPRVERAYIVGGGPTRPVDEDRNLIYDPDRGWVSIGNYGKTAAILKKVEWGFCDESIFPKERPVSEVLNKKLLPRNVKIESLVKEDVYRSGDPPSALHGTEFSIKANDGKIFFGRFTYAILFDDLEHYSTFKMKMGTQGESTGLPGSYSDWS